MRLVKRALEKQERRRKSFDSQSSETVRQMTEENQKLTLEVKKARENSLNVDGAKIFNILPKSLRNEDCST